LALVDRTIEGARFTLARGILPHQESAFAEDSASLLPKMVVLFTRTKVELQDLLWMLDSLSSFASGDFAALAARVQELTLASGDAASHDLLRHHYEIRIAPLAPDEESLAWRFVLAIAEMLGAYADAMEQFDLAPADPRAIRAPIAKPAFIDRFVELAP
jgi:hypothetical protein